MSFFYFFISTFNPCYLAGLIVLSLFSRPVTAFLIAFPHSVGVFLLVPLANALLTVLGAACLNTYFKRRVAVFGPTKSAYFLTTAFIAGFLPIYATVSPAAMLIIFAAVMLITLKNLAYFFEDDFFRYLAPGFVATQRDLFHLARSLLSVVTAFIVINLSIEAIHAYFGLGKAFNFAEGIGGILDSVYFTFVIVTTLGLGDIIPLTPTAKIIVSFESAVSYIMLALIIGMITRGVVKK